MLHNKQHITQPNTQHVWYWPEYGSDYSKMTLLQTLTQTTSTTSTKTIPIEGIMCTVHENNTFSVDVSRYSNWREQWFAFIPAIRQLVKSKQFFSSNKKLSPIRVILYHVDTLSQKEWSMFLLSPFRVDIITRSLTAVDPSYLAKTHLHRIPSSTETITWKEAPWKASAHRLKEHIKCGFTNWRATRDILYEWMLFTVDFEEALFDVFQVLDTKPLSIQTRIMRTLLSLIRYLSINKNREVIKPSIRATTNQHTFYILEQCILVIAKEYHSKDIL